MPCVCLANTFARRKSLKAQKLAARKAAQPLAVSPVPKLAAGAKTLTDGTTVKVPHQHKQFATSAQVNATSDALMQSVQQTQATRKARKRLGHNILKTARHAKKVASASATSSPAPKSSVAPKPAPQLVHQKAVQPVSASKNADAAATSAKSTGDASVVAQSASGISQPIFTRKPSRQLKGPQPSAPIKPSSPLKKLKTLRARRPAKALRATKIDVMPAVNFGRPSVRMTRADLINAESRLGSTIFGPIPAGHRREFFHDRNNIWIWHEDWQDGQNNPHQMTVRYEVRTSGVYKKVSSGKYLKLEGDELENFRKATHAYLYVIKKNLYNQAKMRSAY